MFLFAVKFGSMFDHMFVNSRDKYVGLKKKTTTI